MIFPFLLLLVFISGAAGLIYEVLWLKQLGYLFGNTAQASSLTLAVFFGGLGLGSWWWGQRAHNSKNSLRTYALLELGIVISASFYFLVLKISHVLYPLVVGSGPPGFLILVLNIVLAILLIGPPAIFIGGTIPVLANHIILKLGELGEKGSMLYGINTLGAAIGAFAAGFWLTASYGLLSTYKIALALSFSISICAFLLSKNSQTATAKKQAKKQAKKLAKKQVVAESSKVVPELGDRNYSLVIFLCVFSGFGTLCLEILWTQMFTHVLQNTVYSFASVVVTTLICLGLGAGLANRLIKSSFRPLSVLVVLIALAGVSICISSFLYVNLTDGLSIIYTRESWNDYIYQVFGLCFKIIGPPLVLMGALFPYLLLVSEPFAKKPGQTIGNLSALNTLGGIVGSLSGCFVLLGTLGLWKSIQLMGIIYLVLAVVIASVIINIRHPRSKIAWSSLTVFTLVVLGAQLYPFNADSLPPMRIEKNEKIIDYWNSSSGTVAVVQSKDNLLIKINGHYTLGATRSAVIEKSQTVVPLLLHPMAKSIYYLGLGTGITASEGLNSKYNIKRSVTAELIPDVIKASQKYFKTYTTPLFSDSRSEVVHTDGRQYLATTREKFDIINADLFVLYRKSVGSLFTLEHFRNAREHLNPGGIFVQWIPLYQLTKQEFYIIANTMTRVFPQVTLWRNHFEPFVDVVALVGQLDNSPLLANDITMPNKSRRAEMAANFSRQNPIPNKENILLFYCGNVSGVREIFKDAPINTDDLPYIEYLTPRSSSMQAADKTTWFSGPEFILFLSEMLKSTPPKMDPALNNVTRDEIHRARAGYYLARTYLFYAAYRKNLVDRQDAWLAGANQAKENFRRYWIE